LGIADFAGREVVLDCANGATSRVAPRIAQLLGLRVALHNASPDGRNINDGCGAVHPESISAECARRAAVGVAFDGDGDRVIAVDETGTVVDGDRLIALAALDLRDRGLLAHDTVVVTSMTNLGFHRAMRDNGVRVVTTDVGDRAVLAAMQDGGFVLGGEQSGHVIHASHATTGDGVLSAVLLLDLVRRRDRRLADLAGEVMQRAPQVLRNVRVTNKPADAESLLGDELVRERSALGDDGRIVVRTSGTEPLVRIMVEATSLELAQAVAARLERLVITRS
jgi:phosphoglucosamine mutase